MRSGMFRAAGLLLVLATVLGVPARGEDVEPARITKEELKAKLGDPGLLVVDVRAGADWNDDNRKIAGAVRLDPNDAGLLAGRYAKDRTLVLYCA